MKILYFLDSSFPTVKAYGVTTTRSIEEILKLGHEVTLVCHSSNLPLPSSFAQKCNVINLRISRVNQWFRRVAFANSGSLAKIAWYVSSFMSLLENMRSLNEIKPDFVWSREIPVRFLIKRYPKAISIVEIHNKLTATKIRRIKAAPTKSVILCPISLHLKNELQDNFQDSRVIFSPMGIHEYRELGETETLSSELEKKFSQEVFKLGYFGKLAPGGFSKGFEDLFIFANLLDYLGIQFKLFFVGITNSEKSMLIDSIGRHEVSMENVQIIPQVPHRISLALMERCDVLVLPQNRDPNYVGFPLKALEYAYSGSTILAANSPTNHDVFVGSFQPIWYKSNERESMLAGIKCCFLGNYNADSKVQGIEYARSFSWKIRTSNILIQAVELANNSKS